VRVTGVSSPNGNVDIFGNDIFDTSDDGIEAANSWAIRPAQKPG
jgi:hypothetical protein